LIGEPIIFERALSSIRVCFQEDGIQGFKLKTMQACGLENAITITKNEFIIKKQFELIIRKTDKNWFIQRITIVQKF